MFLVDTNVVSELRRPGRADPRVVAWARDVVPDDLFVSVVTVLEIEIGVLLVERRDAVQGATLRGWLEHQLLPAFDGRILPIDTAVARRCAALHVPDPKAERDALIAATALVHRLIVVTRNVADFAAMGVSLLDPWNVKG
jgi:predicted nucleic acid-binding protein